MYTGTGLKEWHEKPNRQEGPFLRGHSDISFANAEQARTVIELTLGPLLFNIQCDMTVEHSSQAK